MKIDLAGASIGVVIFAMLFFIITVRHNALGKKIDSVKMDISVMESILYNLRDQVDKLEKDINQETTIDDDVNPSGEIINLGRYEDSISINEAIRLILERLDVEIRTVPNNNVNRE